MAVTELAERVTALVHEGWQRNEAGGGIAVADRNGHFFVVGYVRAFRCFDSIRRLAAKQQADDALILTRALLSISFRSLYLVGDDDQRERDFRRRRMQLKYYRGVKVQLDELRTLGAVAEDVPNLDQLIAELEAWFAAEGASSVMPGDQELARERGLDIAYTRIYRRASEQAHFSLGALLGSFAELVREEEALLPVSLYKPDLDGADEVLGLALIAYADFLVRAEAVVELGLKEALDELANDLRAHLEETGQLQQ